MEKFSTDAYKNETSGDIIEVVMTLGTDYIGRVSLDYALKDKEDSTYKIKGQRTYGDKRVKINSYHS